MQEDWEMLKRRFEEDRYREKSAKAKEAWAKAVKWYGGSHAMTEHFCRFHRVRTRTWSRCSSPRIRRVCLMLWRVTMLDFMSWRSDVILLVRREHPLHRLRWIRSRCHGRSTTFSFGSGHRLLAALLLLLLLVTASSFCSR